MDIWNWLQENSGVLALLFPLAGMLYAGYRRMLNALDAAAERRHKKLEERLTGVEDGQKRIEERQTRVEERLTRIEEGQKEVAKSVSDMKGDIRAIWHPALGAFFGQSIGQRSDNHPDETSHS